jgi:hypothetical protein
MPDPCAEQDHSGAETPSSEQSTLLLEPVPLVMSLLLYGSLGKGFRLESLVWDGHPALDRSAVRALCDAPLGALDSGKLLAEVGREGHADRLRFASTARVGVISGLPAPQVPFGGDFGAQLDQHGFNTRPLSGDEFTGSLLVHDHLLAGPTRLPAWPQRNSPAMPGKTPVAYRKVDRRPGDHDVASLGTATGGFCSPPRLDTMSVRVR